MGHDPSLIEGSVSFQFSLEVFGQLSVGVTLLVYTAAVFVHFRKFLLFKFLWFKKIFLKICLLLAVLGLHCCVWARRSKQGLLSNCAWASH